MIDPKPTQAPPSFDGLEFELTDIGEARLALDELPPGIAERARLDPGYWHQQRRTAQASDRALTGEAVKWLMQLPPALRPQKLALQIPRLANFIASVWSNPQEASAALDSLVVDRRGGRRGLPDTVQHEVRLLQSHLADQRAARRDRAVVATELQLARERLEAAGYRVIPPVA